jgi:hypothetical protein
MRREFKVAAETPKAYMLRLGPDKPDINGGEFETIKEVNCQDNAKAEWKNLHHTRLTRDGDCMANKR